MSNTLILVSLPWASPSRPSAAICTLAAFTRNRGLPWQVEVAHEYMEFAERIGVDLYRFISERCYTIGEMLYTACAFSAEATSVIEHVAAIFEREWEPRPQSPSQPTTAAWRATVAGLVDALDSFLSETAQRLASANAVGLTTSYGQLFGNLELCRRIKLVDSSVTTILGGSTVSDVVGPSILRHFAAVDHVIQGEGELALTQLLGSFTGVTPAPEPGPTQLPIAGGGHQRFEQIPRLDELPIPNYDDFVTRAERLGLAWALPVEGSRGCWWDRTARTGRSVDICYFCNLNVQWDGYRAKSAARIVSEVEALTERYRNPRIYFLDNIMPHQSLTEVAERLRAQDGDLSIFMELRANVTDRQILLLAEAGVDHVQFGIEALSTDLLRRMGKGTTALDNLRVMRTCLELGVHNGGNLIIAFPATPQHEIDRAAANILDYALGLQPLSVSRFHLGVGSTVAQDPDAYGLRDLRNHGAFAVGLPPALYDELELFDLDYSEDSSADWGPVSEACKVWREIWANLNTSDAVVRELPLSYRDGGSYLHIRDLRSEAREHVLHGQGRALYLYCTPGRRRTDIAARWADVPEPTIDGFLAEMVDKRLMFVERDRYLSLACAATPTAAKRRILAQ